MGYIIIILFIVVLILASLQNFLKQYRLFLYCLIGVCLILTAGLREVGIDPDSSNYEYTFLNYNTVSALEGVEYSYILLSQIINFFSSDVHMLFLVYAFLGVTTKFIALRKLTDLYFIPILVYISYYFILHECMQIRTGVLSGLFLFIVKYIGDGERKKSLICLLIGFLFHYSALLILPFFFISNKPSTLKARTIWGALIPIAYALAFIGVTFVFSNIDIPYIGNKLSIYQQAQEKGRIINSINILSPRDLASVAIYYYLLFFYKTICIRNKYFPIMMKIYGIGLIVYITLSFFPVLAQRTYMLYSTVTIVLYANIFYTIKQKWAGLSLVALVTLFYLNYGLANLDFYIFWKV